MRIQMQVWNDTLKIHEVKYVNVDEVKPNRFGADPYLKMVNNWS